MHPAPLSTMWDVTTIKSLANGGAGVASILAPIMSLGGQRSSYTMTFGTESDSEFYCDEKMLSEQASHGNRKSGGLKSSSM